MRQITRSTQESPTIHVPPAEVEKALHRANVPVTYTKRTLAEFTWGAALHSWIAGVLVNMSPGKGTFMFGDAATEWDACIMLCRSLILLSKDAKLFTMSELVMMMESRAEMPANTYIIIAGFHRRSISCPYPLRATEDISWWMRNRAVKGTTFVVHVHSLSPGDPEESEPWWDRNMIHQIFPNDKAINLDNV